MELPNTLPCKCTNPLCGYSFNAPNPVGGNAGINCAFTDCSTTCPRCGQAARYADWHTDDKGAFHLHEVFDYVRNIKDTSKLQTLKADLEAANDAVTAQELADTLADIDPSFLQFKNVIKSIPTNLIANFISILVTILTLVILYQTMRSADENHDENIELQKEQIKLSREEFEYKKQKDVKRDIKRTETNKEIEDLQEQINSLRQEFDKNIGLINANNKHVSNANIKGKSNLKGNCRNKPCLCGSGIKAKKCHPDGFNKQ